MNDNERDKQLRELVNLAMDCMGVAVTIIDAKGTLLYYNQHSAKILDRKPEYIGTDIHSHHKQAKSQFNITAEGQVTAGILFCEFRNPGFEFVIVV